MQAAVEIEQIQENKIQETNESTIEQTSEVTQASNQIEEVKIEKE